MFKTISFCCFVFLPDYVAVCDRALHGPDFCFVLLRLQIVILFYPRLCFIAVLFVVYYGVSLIEYGFYVDRTYL